MRGSSYARVAGGKQIPPCSLRSRVGMTKGALCSRVGLTTWSEGGFRCVVGK